MRLEATSDYADYNDDGLLEVTFDDLNDEADFTFNEVFEIHNNGQEDVHLDRFNEDEWDDDVDNGLHILVNGEVFDGDSGRPYLDSGESISIGFGFWSPDGPGGGFGEDADQPIDEAVPETITFNLGG
ncbi:hypothetical protein BBD46_08480 [Natrialba sp. SSL1]|nr:hypothetical protein BBD46_08480 [Natrialba sp. SSL1]